MSDPWAPWAECDPAALEAVFTLHDFEAQCRALLDLAPNKISANMLKALPWDEPHELREFKRIRDAWAAHRALKREQERARDEKPLDETLWETMSNGIRVGDLKSAREAFELMKQITGAKQVRTERDEDDYSRLTPRQVLALAALVHHLRDEPLTEQDQSLLEQIDALAV